MISLMKCAIAHISVLGYFGVATWYAENLRHLMPRWMQFAVGLVYLFSIICAFARLDLFLLCRSGGDEKIISTRFVFFAKVFVYYFSIVALPSVLIYFKDDFPSFFRAYGAFLFLLIILSCSDYAFPSYERYRKIAKDGKIGHQIY